MGANRERLSDLLKRGQPLELMGRAEVAATLGVEPNNLARQAGLPAPVIPYLKRGDLWLASEIKAFAKSREKRRAAA